MLDPAALTPVGATKNVSHGEMLSKQACDVIPLTPLYPPWSRSADIGLDL